ncbi:hypothetical protein LguiA_032281 [Lonicera macranthoides]
MDLGLNSNTPVDISMAKTIRNLGCWMAVAPPLIILPQKPSSNCHELETIIEEQNEERDEDS